MERRALALFAVILVLVGIGAGALGSAFVVSEPEPEDSDPEPGLVWSSAGPNCLESVTTEDGGWVHAVTGAEEQVLTLDLSVAHERNETVAAAIEEHEEGVATLALERVDFEDPDHPWEDEDCPVGTGLQVTATLPLDTERVEVTFEGEPLEELDRTETLSVMQPLEHPVEP